MTKTLSEWKCKSKIRYSTKKSAWESSVYFFKKRGTYSSPYRWFICKKFHLTSSKANPVMSKEFINNFNEWFGVKIL